jgi:serine/threonine protein kinase
MAGVRAVMELSRYYFEVLRKDDAFVLYRGRNGEDASQVLVLSPAGERPSQENLQRLEHEYSLREALNTEWAIRPIAIAWQSDRPVLVSHDPGAELLDQLLSTPLETAFGLRLAIPLSHAIGQLHLSGIIHRAIRPANIHRRSISCEAPSNESRLTAGRSSCSSPDTPVLANHP